MLFVDSRWRGPIGGIQRYATEVIARLGGTWRDLSTSGSPHSPLDVLSRSRLRLTASDVIYSPGYNAGLSRARQIVTVHDLIHLQHPTGAGRVKREYYERVLRPAIRRAGVVLTVSETSRRALVDWLDAPSVSVVNVGNGCSDVFTVAGPVYRAARGYFLYVGAIKQHKNVDVLLRALSLRPEYRLVVVSSDRELAEQRAAEERVDGQVTLISGVSDDTLASIYRGSAGLLFPSLLEGFGLPAVEAMRSGRRVAHWEGCASLTEIVGGSGYSVSDATSAEEWAAAMDGLLARGPLGDAGGALAQYSWDSVATRVRDELRRAQ